ncbi:hypothetical protein [Mangrovicoccus algicola]|uniref:Uncharacterized protein n=1 Tax=Mangrovicoccus algicola TaxID=2771008 RepID=A0A8J7CYK7_9RHOB|nr:hypothetical protein [Mangrovicoccus algicola]MBE3636658.1 hypothetical protein [Mangrovicoccus algicola]
MSPVALAGRHAALLLPAGFAIVPFLPVEAGLLRPALPVLVALATALAVARQPLDPATLLRLLAPAAAARLALWLAACQVLLAGAAVAAGRAAGLDPQILMLVAVFCAAPPLSSSPNLCLMLGYDLTLALRLSLLGTLLAPLLLPAALAATGLPFEMPAAGLALRVLAILAAGIAGGLALQRLLGRARIEGQADLFNGLAAILMIIFLFPLMGGMRAAVAADPGRAVQLAGLALLVNLGGHLAVRVLARPVLPAASARAAGLVFGNRNTVLVLASLPADPLLSLFVALMQLPIYATPFLFSRLDRRTAPCPRSSES